MKPIQKIMSGAIATLIMTSPLLAGNMPYPQNKAYGLEPSVGTELSRADAVKSRFEWYKSTFLQDASNGSYIQAKDTDGNRWTATVSEAHGYGMILSAIFDDQTMFNNMLKFYQEYQNNGYLMDWQIWEDFSSQDGSATDGDMDIAYSLLLADKQWGSSGSYDYKDLANKIISSIWNFDMYTNGEVLPMPGDRNSWYLNTSYGYDSYTRPSDWMAGHFRAFQGNGTGQWSTAADNVYSFYNSYKNSTTGLVPDFFYGTSAAGGSNYIEDATTDGQYYYNACRVPLRFAMDYASSGNSSAKSALDKISSWISSSSGNSADKIYPGYTLGGTAVTTNYTAVEFFGPFGAGLISGSNQTLMNDIWDQLNQTYNYDSDNAYGAALGVLSMLVMTGNWWAPDASNSGNTGDLSSNQVIFDNFGNVYDDPNSQTHLGAAQAIAWGVDLANSGDSSFYGQAYAGTGWWYAGNDAEEQGTSNVKAGSTVLTEDNMDEAVSNNMLDVTFEINSTSNVPYGYASVGAAFTGTITKVNDTTTSVDDKAADLSKMDAVIITYSADKDIWFEFGTSDASKAIGYGGWGYNLTATGGSMKTDTIEVGYLTAQQYSEWADTVAANSSYSWDATGKKAVETLSFNAAGDSGSTVTTNLKVSEIILNGMNYSDFGFTYVNPDNIVTPISYAVTGTKGVDMVSTLANNALSVSFNAEQAGAASVSLFSLNGREVTRVQNVVRAGANTLSVNTANLATGIYLMSVNLNGKVTTSQISIMK